MTNSAGEITFDQDYLPFGVDLPGVGQVEVQNDAGERYKYNGQKVVYYTTMVPDIMIQR